MQNLFTKVVVKLAYSKLVNSQLGGNKLQTVPGVNLINNQLTG